MCKYNMLMIAWQLILLLLLCSKSKGFIQTLRNNWKSPALQSLKYDFYATTVSGLENVLVNEIKTLPDVSDIEASNCGVHFRGSVKSGLSGLMNLRTSLKLMELIADDNRIRGKDDLSAFVDDIDWSQMIEPVQSLAVDVSQGLDLPFDLTHSHFTALTVKNAIVDQFRRNTGLRPNVDTVGADLPLLLYLHRHTASLYRVWSGCHSMHKRGYRSDLTVHKAALRETTAAAVLSLAGWTYDSAQSFTLCDPMCGSGTIPIEAALIAANTAPGLLRYSISNYDSDRTGGSGCDGALPCPLVWKDLQTEVTAASQVWSSVVTEAVQRDKRRELPPISSDGSSSSSRSGGGGLCIRSSDCHAGSLQLAKHAAKKAGVDHLIHFDHLSADQVDPPLTSSSSSRSTTVIVTNPPWDLRLSEKGVAESAWTQLGNLARKCGVDMGSKWDAHRNAISSDAQTIGNGAGGSSDAAALYVLTGNESLPPLMRLSNRALRRKHAFNAAGTKMKLHEYR